MRQKRSSVFETNSSSTHSICITCRRDAELEFPTHLHFRCESFGWGVRKIESPEDKAAYLYASILSLYSRSEAEKAKAAIWDQLNSVGVDCDFEEAVYQRCGWRDGYYCETSVDHAGTDEHTEFVNKVLSNKGRLLRFLFSKDSFVLTGNDNDEEDVAIHVKYRHEEYYKGN